MGINYKTVEVVDHTTGTLTRIRRQMAAAQAAAVTAGPSGAASPRIPNRFGPCLQADRTRGMLAATAGIQSRDACKSLRANRVLSSNGQPTEGRSPGRCRAIRTRTARHPPAGTTDEAGLAAVRVSGFRGG